VQGKDSGSFPFDRTRYNFDKRKKRKGTNKKKTTRMINIRDPISRRGEGRALVSYLRSEKKTPFPTTK